MSVANRQINPEAAVLRPRAGRWWALAALVLAGLVVALDTTVLITALPTLSSKLGATTSDLQWIAAAYTLALGGLLLPAGVLGDRYGRKRLLLAGVVIFGIGSVIASQVTSSGSLIIMRALMGVGGALIVPLTFSILPILFSDAERPKAVAAAAAGAFLGLPLGPLVAGWLLTHYAWGSVFLINAPVALLAFLGVLLFVPESRDPQPRPFDVVGGVLAVAGVSALVYGVIEEPAYGWTDGRVLAGLIGGAIVLAAFVAWDLRRASPFVDLRNFRNRGFTWASSAFVVAGFGLFGVMFILTPYIQLVMGNDAQATGIKLLPLIGGVMVGAGIGNQVAMRLGARVAISAGFLVGAAGLVIFSRVGADSGYTMVAVALGVIGVGMGIAFPTSLDVVLGVLPPSQTGAGTALTRSLQQVAASFGVAILGSVLNSTYQHSLSPHVAGLPSAARSVAEGSLAGGLAVAGRVPPAVGHSLAHAARVAYTSGMSDVMLVSAASMVVAAVCIGLLMPSRIEKIDEAEWAR